MSGFREWLGGRRLSFVAGFAAASVLFGGLALASDYVQKEIQASFLPLTYVFDGTEKQPPADQLGFTYNERTFVPLRFMAESLGQPVNWDGNTYTIYVGRKPGAMPADWQHYTTDGTGTTKVQFFPNGVRTLMGQEMTDTLLFTAFAPVPQEGTKMDEITQVYADVQVEPGAKSYAGQVIVPLDGGLGARKGTMVGQVTILNDRFLTLYKSEVMAFNAADPLPFDVPLQESTKIRVIVSLYQNQGRTVAGGLVANQIGLANLHFKH